VADDQGVIVFIEVRTRRETGTFGTPSESIDIRKIRQVRETAMVYLKQHQLLDKPIRFDVVSVLLNKDAQLIKLEHIKGAF
jgi:putative endonuclease